MESGGGDLGGCNEGAKRTLVSFDVLVIASELRKILMEARPAVGLMPPSVKEEEPECALVARVPPCASISKDIEPGQAIASADRRVGADCQ